MGRKAIPFADRFWAKVKRGKPNECWEWQGSRWGTNLSYGQIHYEGHSTSAHRVAWMLTHGSLPLPGLEICHACDNPLCCNPKHLWIGTHYDNMMDKDRKGRGKAASRPGENNPFRKLTYEQVQEIRQLCAAGTLTQRQIAARFGIAQPLVSYIHNNKSWNHGDLDVRAAADE